MQTVRHHGSMPILCTFFLAAGCGAPSFMADTATATGDLLAMKVADYSGTDVLAAQADAITEDSRIVSLPVELAQEPLAEAVIALTPADIVVSLDGTTSKVRSRFAKDKASHASVVFRLAGAQDEACMSELSVGPFELTIEDGIVSVDPTELPIPVEALALLRNGELALCAETQADFDGTISLGEVAIESGSLHGHEERVKICHMPAGGENEKNEAHEAHTITVGSSAVDAHLDHGDYLGKCDKADEQDRHGHDADANVASEEENTDIDADEDDGEDSGNAVEAGDDGDRTDDRDETDDGDEGVDGGDVDEDSNSTNGNDSNEDGAKNDDERDAQADIDDHAEDLGRGGHEGKSHAEDDEVDRHEERGPANNSDLHGDDDNVETDDTGEADGHDDDSDDDDSDDYDSDDSDDDLDDATPVETSLTCDGFAIDGAVEFSDFANPKRVGVDRLVAGVDTVVLGFDRSVNGDPIVAGTIINSLFKAVGVRLSAVLTNGPHAGEATEMQALDSGAAPNLLSQVGISPPNILSAVDPDLGPQYSGQVAGLATMIVSFVTPSGEPAKVAQVGAFNDLIFRRNTLTAYAGPDATGRVLGTASAAGPGDFFGLSSSAGIASVTFSGYSTEIDDLVFSPVFVDCNNNGLPDRCDLANGTSQDTNGDGIPDECDDADGDGVINTSDTCPDTTAGATVDANGCATSQLTATVTVPGPTDIYLAGQPDGTTATWPFTGFTSNAPQHSPVMIDISTWAGKDLRFSATGFVITGGNNGATPDGRGWVLRPNGLSQVFGLTAMMGYREGTLVGVFLTDAPPTPGLLPYMSTSGKTTTTPLLQHVFVIGSSSQIVIPTGATRLFFGVAEQQGLIIDNSGSFEVTVDVVPHTLLPSDPLAATRFYVGNPNDPKDGIGWFDNGQWAFDYDFDGVADFTTTFGQAGDQPIVGDWNGDGLDEIGVMAASASGNVWVLDMNGNGVFDAPDASFTYGADAGAIAIAGDWDGDGVFELGFTTPDNLWHLDFDGSRTDDTGGSLYTQYARGEVLNTQYGANAPVIGDWTGDGVSNLGNMSSGSVGWRFDLDRSWNWVWGTTYRDQNWAWGNKALDTGVAGDWDGDGLDDPTRYRVSTGDWHFTTRMGKGVLVRSSVIGFGANATPVAGSWATVRAAP